MAHYNMMNMIKALQACQSSQPRRAHLGEPGVDAAVGGGHGGALLGEAGGSQGLKQVGERLLFARARALLGQTAQLQRPLRHLARQRIQRSCLCGGQTRAFFSKKRSASLSNPEQVCRTGCWPLGWDSHASCQDGCAKWEDIAHLFSCVIKKMNKIEGTACACGPIRASSQNQNHLCQARVMLPHITCKVDEPCLYGY